MKPVSLVLQCFGPYLNRQEIIFSELAANGLFLICGETGAGKTAILDAICYALYGRSSGGLRGDLEGMRCKQAGKDQETYIEYVFEAKGKRYKFSRSLKYGRKNINDEHICCEWDGQVYVPLFENPVKTRVNDKAKELLGLTYEQFRQVIILPQGQFEKFLVSDSKDKEEILKSLFQTDRWELFAKKFAEQAKMALERQKQEEAAIIAKLGEYACRSLPDLALKMQETESALQELEKRQQMVNAQEEKSRQAYECALQESKDFEILHQWQEKIVSLNARRLDMTQENAVLEQAEAAASIERLYDDKNTVRKKQEECRAAVEQAQRVLSDTQEQLAAALARKKAHDKSKAEQAVRQQDIVKLEGARELYRDLGQKKEAVQQARQQQKKAEKTQKAAFSAYTAANEDCRQAIDEQNRAIKGYQVAQASYFHNISGILAQKLVPGESCPVCGSTSHPVPAVLDTETAVTEEELEQYSKALDAAKDKVNNLLSIRSLAEEKEKAAHQVFLDAKGAVAAAESAYDESIRHTIPEIESIQDLEKRLTLLKEQSEAYHREEQSLGELVTDLQGKEQGDKRVLEAAKHSLAESQTASNEKQRQWQEALAGQGFTSQGAFLSARMKKEELKRRKEKTSRYKADCSAAQTALEEQQERLKGRTEPDVSALKQQAEKNRKCKETIDRDVWQAHQKLNAFRSDFYTLAKRQKQVDDKRAEVEENRELANCLQGANGISLQRYVLGVMLTSVTAEANRLLSSVYGGRYQLYRTDEGSGKIRTKGLELDVLDNYSGQRRRVTTLSGGEKFLAALSLAIGLSTVVQTRGKGIQMEAMFIDEGFGSLDSASIDDALQILQDISNAHGLVGIISHVQRLAEMIPYQLEVTKGWQGSRIIPHY